MCSWSRGSPYLVDYNDDDDDDNDFDYDDDDDDDFDYDDGRGVPRTSPRCRSTFPRRRAAPPRSPSWCPPTWKNFM